MTEEEIARRRRGRTGLLFGAVLFAFAFFWGTTGGGAAFAEQQPSVSVVNPGGTPVWGGDALAQIQSGQVKPGAHLRSEFAVQNAGAVGAKLDLTIDGQADNEQYVQAAVTDESNGKVIYEGPLASAAVHGYHIGLGTASQRVFRVDLSIDAAAPTSIQGQLIAPTIAVNATASR